MRLTIALAGLLIGAAMFNNALAQDANAKAKALAAAKANAESVSGELTSKCSYPKAPSIPNGKTASKDELLATQKNMKAYLAKGNDFLACLDNVQAAWSDDEKKAKGDFIVMFHNKMVDDMNEVADLFNTSVRAFKGRK